MELDFFGNSSTRDFGPDFDHFRMNLIDTPGFKDSNEEKFIRSNIFKTILYKVDQNLIDRLNVA